MELWDRVRWFEISFLGFGWDGSDELGMGWDGTG